MSQVVCLIAGNVMLTTVIELCFFFVDLVQFVSTSESGSDEGLFREQKLIQVRFCAGIVAPLQPLPAAFHQGVRHLLAALGVAVGVGAEVVSHCFGGAGGQTEVGLHFQPLLGVHPGDL